MGEHAVVYGRPALVAALGLRLHVVVSAGEGSGVRIELPALGFAAEPSWQAIQEYAASARASWNEFAKHPSQQSFSRMRGDDPAHVVKVALGEALQHCDGGPFPPLCLRLESAIPIGAGFGSSAAAAVAVLGGILTHLRVAHDLDTLDRLALEVERRQHGLPSGIDHLAVLHGGVLWARKLPTGTFAVEPLAMPQAALSRLHVLHTGTPLESTGAVVAAVRDRLGAAPAQLEPVLDRMEGAASQLRERLALAGKEPAVLLEPIREYEWGLEQLGVVPEAVRRIVRQVEARGGAAKISGAGALTGTGAGCLLVYHPSAEKVAGWDFLQPLQRYDVPLGVEGLRVQD